MSSIQQADCLLLQTTVKFGVRKLEVIGYHWKLNGKWLYLHGYGDDSIYPMFTSPPVNHTFYKERLEFAREYSARLLLSCTAATILRRHYSCTLDIALSRRRCSIHGSSLTHSTSGVYTICDRIY